MSHASSIPIVHLVDADVSMLERLEPLISAAGWHPQMFTSAFGFLAHPRPSVPSCLILDVSLPDLSGLELQDRLGAESRRLPIIFLSCSCDISTTVKAMKGGALEFLTKPFDAETLLSAIRNAIRQSEAALGRESQMHSLRADYGSLTPREREVMLLVVFGLLNKQVGSELGISEITVKAHRGSVMRKMKANSFAELVNMALRLRLSRPLLMSAA